jgi:uncharacterized Ntn-hydrolase superfamily protein
LRKNLTDGVLTVAGYLAEAVLRAVQFARGPVHEQVVEAIAAGRIKRGKHGIYGSASVVVVVRGK